MNIPGDEASRAPFRLVDRLCHDQTHRWRQGERPTVEGYLSQHSELSDHTEDLFDLVYNELQLRRTLLDQFDLVEFIKRFPQFSQRLMRQLRLHDAIQSVKDSSRGSTETGTAAAPAATLGLASGQQLGRYRVQRWIGAGGFGVVYLATDTQLNREVALKIPRIDDLPAEQQKRFLQEAELAASLEHPHLVAVYDAGKIDEISYIATAFCPGQNLAQYLRVRETCDLRTAVEIAVHLADAMDHAHQRGVIHRDLKPSNVMLTDKPCGDLPFTPQITDFGLAKLGEQRMRDTSTSLVMGTPLYMAPEQYRGRKTTGPPTDVYALGVILYEMLTGEPPYDGDNYFAVANAVMRGQVVSPRRLNPAVSRDLAAIVMQCIEREPQHRYDNCGDLARDLRQALAGRRVSIRRPNLAERFVQWANERQRIYEAGAVACWLAICMATWMVVVCFATLMFWPKELGFEKADFPSEWVTSMTIVVTLVLPMLASGIAILFDKAWGLYVGPWFAGIPVLMVLFSIGEQPTVHQSVYGDNIMARFLVFSLIFFTHFALLALLLNALRVHWREQRLNRRRLPPESAA
ncbi:serine/threonine-protein kinase [Blastopirellula marina]|uniref:Serine/threonine protein kinase n=1 Tax=Blastopirellula marina DSM 3645 TaxID=314230 RepID=A3ZN78_9BACT|nr:serine/threonine-protein kinase [Blastopirellula marina]EAQ81770.1 serine/threonine protein kinase [Blastopirellula marina DSM 3645]